MTSWRDLLDLDRQRAHREWLYREGTGEGQFILEDKDLTGAQLRGGNFERAKFSRVDFGQAAITYSEWKNSELSDCVAFEAGFAYGAFRGAALVRCRFIRTDLRRTTFTDARLEGCDLSESTLSETHFVASRVRDVCFRGVSLFYAQLDEGQFDHCDLRETKLGNGAAYEAHFENCDLRGAALEGWALRNTTFTRCKLYGMTGKPKLDGEVTLIEPDLSPEGDGTQIVSADEVLRLWRA